LEAPATAKQDASMPRPSFTSFSAYSADVGFAAVSDRRTDVPERTQSDRLQHTIGVPGNGVFEAIIAPKQLATRNKSWAPKMPNCLASPVLSS
jgi:hypothetical protein